jgi:hypothetical protein
MNGHELEKILDERESFPLVIMTNAGIPYTAENRLCVLVGARMVVIKSGDNLLYLPLKNISDVIEQ